MSWNYDKSLERIEAHLDSMGTIDVEPLAREADLEALLSETRCREIFGAHVYFDVPNFAELATSAAGDEAALKRLAQAVHVYEREVCRIVESTDLFDGVRVHFQGAKLHALLYRPYDAVELATRAVLLQLVLRDFMANVFNPTFPKLANFRGTGGADLGDVIGTRNGMSGDRELLFLGAPANYAAKIVGHPSTLSITELLYESLPKDLQAYCAVTEREGPDGTPVYELTALTGEELTDLCEEYGIDWNQDASAERVAEDKAAVPLSEIRVEDAEVKIDLDSLSIRRNKLVAAASIFADVSGFTKYVDSAETDDEKQEALRAFHGIRREMSRVVRHDYDGLRIQYQGDRLQGLFHMPAGKDAAIVTKSVEAAVGLQSSMRLTLPKHLPEVAHLALAIGIDIGPTFVSKLGTRGRRDRISIGAAVEQAALCEERHDGGIIALTPRAYDLLPDELQEFFTEDEATGDFVARDLTAEKFERALQKSMYGRGPVYVKTGAAGATVARAQAEESRAVHPARSWAT